jgi:perosamine synthetase
MIPIGTPLTDEQEIAAVSEVLRSGMLAQGPGVEMFEKEFSSYCGTRHGIAMNNGTAALHATLLALGIGPGDEVILPAFTFFATASSVCMCGAKPVFVDVDRETFNLSIDALQNALSAGTRAVIGVHLFGQPFEVNTVKEICGERGIHLVEDAAQAHGATCHGRKVGSFGTAGCFSFYPTKNMTTGEGGFVTTDDDQVSQKIRQIINHGQSEKYLHTMLGFNYRMTDIGASIGLAQLRKLDSFNARRRETAQYYNSNLRYPGLIPPRTVPGSVHVYHQYVVRVTEECRLNRDQVAMKLKDKGIGTAVHYPIPLHRQPVFSKYARQTHCPVSEALAKEVLSLPVHPRVTDADREYICSCINEVT